MGDVCSVKVAARRDASEADCIRLQQLAQQVGKYPGGYLMACLHPRSEEYVGDVCSVKVAARRDASEVSTAVRQISWGHS